MYVDKKIWTFKEMEDNKELQLMHDIEALKNRIEICKNEKSEFLKDIQCKQRDVLEIEIKELENELNILRRTNEKN